MYLTVDRTEEGIVLLRDACGLFYHFPVSSFDASPRDGDVFCYVPYATVPLIKDIDRTKAQKERANSRFEGLLARQRRV